MSSKQTAPSFDVCCVLFTHTQDMYSVLMFHLIEMKFYYGVNTCVFMFECCVLMMMTMMISNCHLILKIQIKFKNSFPITLRKAMTFKR